LRARHARNLEHRRAAGRLGFDFDFLVVQFACAQFPAEGIARSGTGVGADQCIEHTILSGLLRTRLHIFTLAFAGLHDCDLDEVAHDLLNIAADITDLGELRGLNLDERRIRQPGEPPRDLGLADTGRPDHQDVLGQYFLAQRSGELLPPPTVTQRDGNRALGVALSDNEAVEFGNDFAGREVCHGS